MKDIFFMTGLRASMRSDGDVDLTVTLQTQVSPAMVTDRLNILSPLYRREVSVTIEGIQSVIPGTENVEPGKIREFINKRTGEVK